MSTYTRKRHSPQGRMHGSIYTQAQRGVVAGRRADQDSQPFPNKPVSHKRPDNPKTQDSLDLSDFEKITITKQSRGPLPPQERHSDGRDTTGSRHPRKDSHRLPSGELEMTRAIHEKQLVLQEKLWRVEAKVRQKIQRARDDAAQKDDYDQGQSERGKIQTKTRFLEQQRREPVRSRGLMIQDRGQEAVKQQMMRDRMRHADEEERAWRRRETEVEQFERKGRQGTHEITVRKREVRGKQNQPRWDNVKEHTRRKGSFERDDGNWGERDGRSKEKAKERQQSTSHGDKDWTREKKYREDMQRELSNSDREDQIPRINQHKTSHQTATQNHRGGERNLYEEQLLPPASSSSYSSRQEEQEVLPCKVCGRRFTSQRLEKHVLICEKLKQSNRQVFNSFANRTKGSDLGEYLKTHSSSRTPEVLKKKKQRQNNMANTKNLREVRLPAGTSKRFK
ncbi:zinc finger C2HC domain-containing protein 1C-like [Labrus mixtus]|uniref:zinc finger C2HC domain-containing protein 1C-like n=1 Tax=Labrus mixtus TaxID=508554 RepID=UPI0029C069DB|nr:zinc finger C2HC domain-containing protein 1C-like [Labrus mixtus]